MKKRRKGVVLFYFESKEGEFLNVVFCSFLFCQTKETYIIYQIERLPVFSFLIFWEREWEGEEKKKKRRIAAAEGEEGARRCSAKKLGSASLPLPSSLSLFLSLSFVPSFYPSLLSLCVIFSKFYK